MRPEDEQDDAGSSKPSAWAQMNADPQTRDDLRILKRGGAIVVVVLVVILLMVLVAR